MDDENNSEAPAAGDSPGAGRGHKRERGLSKALSVLRASTKLQQQKRSSSSHARAIEEEEGGAEVEEDSASIEDSSRRRTGSGMTSLPRNINRQRAPSIVGTVDGQRQRNAPRGEWSPAEEAVLARKHMELGNKWTTISHFLPARSDNDVKNIWHSTLRSKNSERRSFLRTYARAVRDCANDAEARKQAYEMAQRVCGPPQPIEQALATVQQQYQQQLQMQANQQDEVLADGDSPEFEPDAERDSDQPAPGPGPDGPQPHSQAPQPAQESLGEVAVRSGTCSRTNSAPDSQQHSGGAKTAGGAIGLAGTGLGGGLSGAGGQQPQPPSSGGLELDDFLGGDLDLTAEDLMAMLGPQTSSQRCGPGSALLDSSLDAAGAHGTVFHCGDGGGGGGGRPSGPPRGAAGDRQQQQQLSVPLLPPHHLQDMQQQQQQQQPDAFDSLLAELEQRGRLHVVQPHPPLAGMLSLPLPEMGTPQQQQQPQQQPFFQDDVLGLGPLGTPYASYSAAAFTSPYHCTPGPNSLDLHSLGAVHRVGPGLVAPHNTYGELQSLASCSSTAEVLTSGQQGYLDPGSKQHLPQLNPTHLHQHQQLQLGPQPLGAPRRGSALGMFGTTAVAACCNESYSNGSSGLLSPRTFGAPLGLTSLNGTTPQHQHQQRPPGATGGTPRSLQTVGSGGGGGGGGCSATAAWQSGIWAPGLLRGVGSGAIATAATDSSPAATAAVGTESLTGEAAGSGAGACMTGSAGATPPPPPGSAVTAVAAGDGGGCCGSGGFSGQTGSGLLPVDLLSFLAAPAKVDVVTMGLDSGDLLDCMDCEGEALPETGSAGGGCGGNGGGGSISGCSAAEPADPLTLLMSGRGSLAQRPPPPQQQQQQVSGGRGGLVLRGAGGGAGGGGWRRAGASISKLLGVADKS
ncbi:hypothetical protein VOLCADRAFT_97533 [Volvox carteri f. nagariensis]|uniref:Uncharacterized protein n=1 Tax=Volvox carteri f. nagariensis TaxID=3068 RepID=D8UCZ5_VOLCA|nr:uncharacterized protein VOLCADRAFT_97533 [Volvox carteri f. nagariensis]EFJ42477.1 hypothetical protein VOLCADRAFT_97533 [Volvox carteri f. nagariensis]|eukprot:XP_002956540.1 hypothetical protein VOLCADRAFT_97533 [Volvox carteri f. nagariensis]